MKQLKQRKIKKRLKNVMVTSLVFMLFVFVIAACRIVINSVEQPPSVNAGDTAHFVIKMEWAETNNDHTERQVAGILVPKSWHAAQNATAYLTSTISNGNQPMELIPSSQTEPSSGLSWPNAFMKKFGIGPNLIDEMEWVVFWSSSAYFVANQTNPSGVIYINIKSGTNNLSFKPGYAICEGGDGLKDESPQTYYTSTFGTCLEVLEGEGDLQDFCNPQIGAAEPSNATKNDLLSFKYDGNVDTSLLKNSTDVFWCAKAYTTTGQVIEVCSGEEKSKMQLYDQKKWRIDIWPSKYFNLSKDQELTLIEYYFTTKTGDIKVGYGDLQEAFKYSVKCK